MPENIAISNSNRRLAQCVADNNPEECQSDSYSKKWGSTVPWNPTTRTIEPAQNTTLTLTGGDYFICHLNLGNNSHLIMGDPAAVRIFFDTPENCHMQPGESQIQVENNADITSSGYQPAEGKFDVLELYLLGSTTIPTTALFKNNTGATNEFVLYGPDTDIYMENNSTYKGAIAGKSIHLSNHAKVEQDNGFEPPNLGGQVLYSRQSYVECVGATATPHNADC